MVNISDKPFKDREELKKDIRKWRAINIGCLVIAALLIIAGAASKIYNMEFTFATDSYFLLGIFFAVVSVAPHIQVAIDKHLYGLESEK